MAGDPIPVHIHMVTEHVGGDQDMERERLEAVGRASFTAARWVIRFSERSDDRVTGRTTIKVTDEQLTLIRSGDVTMRQVFIPDCETRGMYHHPYGSMEMITTTQDVYRRASGDEWQIGWRYVLALNGADVGAFHINVMIRRDRSGEDGKRE